MDGLLNINRRSVASPLSHINVPDPSATMYYPDNRLDAWIFRAHPFQEIIYFPQMLRTWLPISDCLKLHSLHTYQAWGLPGHAGDKNPRTAQKFAHFHLNAPPSTTTYLIQP